jgi:transcriptional regulator with XRE-family HTH domain
VIRPRGGTTRRRDDEGDGTASAQEIGRLLRYNREQRGLDLLAVHDRLGRPITQIEALEQGDLNRLPDQALALSTLRRYAAFLGLDGDALALQMIDAWSSTPATPAPVAEAGTAAKTTVVTAVTAGPDHLRAFTQTGEVPKVGGGSSGPPTGSGASGYGVTTGPPTGTFPVVPRQDLRQSKRAVAKARRRLRAPTLLKVGTWIVAVLAVAAIAGLFVYRSRPQWLVQAHILKVVQPGGPAAAGKKPVTAGGSKGAAAAPRVVSTATTPQTGSFTVNAAKFVVTIGTSGKCWMEVTSSASQAPLLVGIQAAGKTFSFPSDGTMTVQVGASAVLVSITIDKKVVWLNAPTVTPYTYTFAPASTS